MPHGAANLAVHLTLGMCSRQTPRPAGDAATLAREPGQHTGRGPHTAFFPILTPVCEPGLIPTCAAGNYHALQELLPRWLDSLASTRDGDLTQHAVVVALGASALDLCQRQKWNHGYSHQCVLDQSWPGPDRQYEFASPWCDS